MFRSGADPIDFSESFCPAAGLSIAEYSGVGLFCLVSTSLVTLVRLSGSAPRLKDGSLPAVPGGGVSLGLPPCRGSPVFLGAGFALGLPGTAGFGQCVQMPSSLGSRRLAWIESRCCSLRPGVLFLFLLYPRRFSFLASTCAGVGSTRGLGVLGVRSFGTTFLGGFRVGGFWV